MFTITLNEPINQMDNQSHERAYISRAVEEAMKEFTRGGGAVTSGEIISQGNDGTSHQSLGSWTYTPVAAA